MIFVRAAITGIAVLTASCSLEKHPTTGETDGGITLASAPSRMVRFDSAGHTWIRATSERWLITRLYRRGDDTPVRVWIRESAAEVCCWEAERETGRFVTLEAWIRAYPGEAKSAWQATAIADDGELWSEFYRAVLRGCCGAEDLLSYYSIKTGGAVFYATRALVHPSDELPSLTVPNSPLRRMIAFHDGFSPEDPPEAAVITDLVGVLQYGPPEGPATRVLLRSQNAAGTAYRLHHVAFKGPRQSDGAYDLDLWSANGSDEPERLSGFSIEIVLLSENGGIVSVSLPVVADTVAYASAVLPRDLLLQKIPTIVR